MSGLLLLWLLIWSYWGVEPRLVYLAGGANFSLAPEFVRPFLSECGGLARYCGAFLAQLDYYPWLGAALRCGQAAAICLLAQSVVARIRGQRAPAVGAVAMAPYMLLTGRLDAGPCLGLMAGGMLVAAWVGAVLPWAGRGARWVGHVLLLGLAAWAVAGAAGPTAMWLMLLGLAVLLALAERERGGRLGLGWALAYLLPALLAAWVGREHLPAAALAGPPAPVAVTRWCTWLLLTVTPLMALLPATWPARARRTAPPTSPAEQRRLRALATVAAVALVHLLAMRMADHQPERDQARRDELRLAERWPELLAEAAAAPPSVNPLAAHDVFWALARMDRLSETMFCYPVRREALLLPLRGPVSFAYSLRLADQCMAIGRLNAAAHALHNALPYTGTNPYLLRRLATVYMAKGDTRAARLYLHVLAGDLIHGGWARGQLRLIATNPGLEGVPEIAALRANQIDRDDMLEVTDVASGSDDLTYFRSTSLANLLDANPRNRLALEYLMAQHLLAGRPDVVAFDLARLKAAGLGRLPGPWEDALLLHEDDSRQPLDLGPLTISDDARRRFARYRACLAAHEYYLPAARDDIAQALGGTYLSYFAHMEKQR